jgi:acetolactate synthase-1/2/3 large subunit/sulfoacetaldehyde acetyltransferase
VIHDDGDFLMNAQEIETAVRHGIPVVTLVMNNNCRGSEKVYQKHFYGGRYVGTDLTNPRYDREVLHKSIEYCRRSMKTPQGPFQQGPVVAA